MLLAARIDFSKVEQGFDVIGGFLGELLVGIDRFVVAFLDAEGIR